MFWLAITASAALLPAEEPPHLEPALRTWGGGGDCDAATLIRQASEHIEGSPWSDDPAEVVHQNMHVLKAWDRARRCGEMDRHDSIQWTFQEYSFGGVLLAAAKNAERRGDKDRAAELGVELFVFGNDIGVGSLVSAMVASAVQQSALDLLAEVWPDLSAERREVFSRKLRHVRRTFRRIDVEGERHVVRELAAHSEDLWMPEAACVAAADASLDRVERVLDGAPRSLLGGEHDDGWLAWMGARCGRGIESVTLDWLEEQDAIEGELMLLESHS